MAKTERLEVRMTPEEFDRLRDAAAEQGRPVSALVRERLGPLLDPNDEDDPETTTGGWIESRVDLSEWLSQRTGMPKAVCALKIARGKLRLAGTTWIEQEAPAKLLSDRVEFDGEPISG